MNDSLSQVGAKHFILTRFNVVMDTQKPKALAQINLATDEAYLDRRFALFQKYTVPSMQGQTCPNFNWLVLFHADTPQKYKAYIAELQREYPAFCPIFVSPQESYLEAVNAYMLRAQASRYIMSRIDNDDAFHASFVEQVQADFAAIPQTEYILIYPNGAQYYERQQIAARYLFPFNHFSTLVSAPQPDGSLKNILVYNHMEIEKDFVVKEVFPADFMWLEVIHDSNVTNRLKIKRKNILRDKESLAGFGAALELSKNAYRIACFYAIFQRPINAARLLKSYGIKGCLAKVAEKAKRK